MCFISHLEAQAEFAPHASIISALSLDEYHLRDKYIVISDIITV